MRKVRVFTDDLHDCILNEAIASGIIEPWVLVRTANAGVHPQRLSRQLLVVGKLAAVWHQAVLSRTRGALLLPGSVVLGGVDGHRVLDPLDDLGHGDEVGLWVTLQHSSTQ